MVVLMVLTGALVWLLGGRLVAGHTAIAQGSVTLSKEPQVADLFIGGDDLIISEVVAGIPEEGDGLGRFEFAVVFNGQVVDVSVSEGPFLKSTGRTTSCFSSSFENVVQFSCNSVGSQPGPTGSGVLAYITVRPKPSLVLRPTLNNGVIAVLDNLTWAASLSDPLGDPIPVGEVLDGFVTVRALEGDLNKDCIVNVVDEQIISHRYQATFGSLLYRPFYDLEPSAITDGDIDIKDLQFVYGRDGTACEEEIPPTPTPTATGEVVTGTPTPTATPTNTPTPTACNDAMAVDAVSGGPIDGTGTVIGGAPFIVDIVITQALSAYQGYQYMLEWDPAVLAFDSQTHLKPADLTDCSTPILTDRTVFAGCMRSSGTTSTDTTPFTGPVNTVTLHCVAAGTSPLHLRTRAEEPDLGTGFLGAGGEIIDCCLRDASVTCEGVPTATPTITPTATGTPATAIPTPTATGTPPTATATPTATGTPTTATPTATRVPVTVTPTSTASPAAPTATPVLRATVIPPAATPTSTPSPTVVLEGLPLAGSGGAGSTSWTTWPTTAGLALVLGGAVLLYVGVRLRPWAALRRAWVDDSEARYVEALALFRASLEEVLAVLETRRQKGRKN